MLVLDAFGHLSLDMNLIDAKEEDLYSVFRSRSELMGWYIGPSTRSIRRRQLLWNMHEAELTAANDISRIGWTQVGLDVGDFVRTQVSPPSGTGCHYAPHGFHQRSIEPAVVLPALTQCFVDALARFGIVELAGLQVICHHLEPGPRSLGNDLPSAHNWFNTNRKTAVHALVAFSEELLYNHDEVDLVANLSGKKLGRFEFGPAVAVPEQHWIKVAVDGPSLRHISPAPSGIGLSVRMPEWTATAVGWVLAIIIDAARVITPDVPDFAVRVTRYP